MCTNRTGGGKHYGTFILEGQAHPFPHHHHAEPAPPAPVPLPCAKRNFHMASGNVRHTRQQWAHAMHWPRRKYLGNWFTLERRCPWLLTTGLAQTA